MTSSNGGSLPKRESDLLEYEELSRDFYGGLVKRWVFRALILAFVVILLWGLALGNWQGFCQVWGLC